MRRPKDDIGVRRFAPTARFDHAGQTFRITEGEKQPWDQRHRDLRIDWWSASDGKWVAIPMSAVFLLVDFFYENEHVLYPPSRGFLGGEKFLRACRAGVTNGWLSAAKGVDAERKQSRLFGEGEVA